MRRFRAEVDARVAVGGGGDEVTSSRTSSVESGSSGERKYNFRLQCRLRQRTDSMRMGLPLGGDVVYEGRGTAGNKVPGRLLVLRSCLIPPERLFSRADGH